METLSVSKFKATCLSVLEDVRKQKVFKRKGKQADSPGEKKMDLSHFMLGAGKVGREEGEESIGSPIFFRWPPDFWGVTPNYHK